MSQEDDERNGLVSDLREVRETAREAPREAPSLPRRSAETQQTEPLKPLPESEPRAEAPTSPARESLNALWDLGPAKASAAGKSFLSRLAARLSAKAVDPVVDRQTEMNAAQVRFDNEIVAYLDARLDRLSAHYDDVLGGHGQRMAEIDERHLILQQELIRHVHDLVERIEYVFESAETNHLYVEGLIRETREELRRLTETLGTLAPAEGGPKRDDP